MTNSVWTDDPLSSSAADTLERTTYARQAAELIHSTHTFKSSAVFGLSGPWGSGKTSLVNMIVEHLRESHPEWAVARFTPWATSDVTGLLGEFYSSLTQALPQKKSRQVRRALAITAGVAAPAATLIPYAGGSASEAIKTIGVALTKSPPWEKAFQKASAELKKLHIPILVVVDDIDRLHVDELMALLRVVRLLGRFDGVEYLLAYDDETLFRSLSAASAIGANDGTAERFMEKIVQYPLLVPPLLQHQQIARLNAGLKSVSRGDSNTDDARLSASIDSFVALLRTPRAIDRYIAQLQHHLPLIPADEIDDSDVLLLTLIRVSFPHLFNAIPAYRKELIAGHTGELAKNVRKFEYQRFNAEPLIALAPDQHRDVARQLLVSLFPKIREEGQISVNGSNTRRGVANEEYFDRYFAMGIPAHDVSDVTVQAAVTAAATGENSELTALLVPADDSRRLLALSKGTNPENQPSTDAGRLRLVGALADIANQLPDEDGTPFSSQDQTLTWLGRLLIALDPSTSPRTVLAALGHLSGSILRIRTWRTVEYELERRHVDALPGWYQEVTDALATEAVGDFLTHLEQGDNAPTEFGVGYKLHFAIRSGRTDELQSKIAELIEAGKIDRSTLASRIVSVRGAVGVRPNWELVPEFDQDTYNRLAPPGNDPWYDAPIEDVDFHDLSWANRRRFVAGRVAPPPETAGPTV